MLTPPPAFKGIFRVDDDARAVYSEGAGIARLRPSAVAVPRDADDLALLVLWAAETGMPLTPRGSGSSMANGSLGAGTIVDLSRWNWVGEVDPEVRTIRCGPGALRDTVNAAARAHGFRFPIDPSSGAFCTIGGMASTNAAGAHTMFFGSMRPWVRAIDCVFADGSRGEVRRGSPPPNVEPVQRFLRIADRLVAAEHARPSVHPRVIKESSGYGLAAYAKSGELVDLLVGSEGTLAFFVAVELDLVPDAVATSSVLGAFSSIDDAVRAAILVRAAGAVACELLDRTFLDVAASEGAQRQVPAETESALMVEVEGETADIAAARAAAVATILKDSGAGTIKVALDAASEHDLWELRHAASPILSRLDPNLRSMQFIEDCAVPPENLAAYVLGVREVLAANDTRGVIFGHAGDAHVHVNPLIDTRYAAWRDRFNAILDGVVSLAARLGGTLAGEHGDGSLRTPLLHRVWPRDVLDRFADVKKAFNPRGILNPGVKVAAGANDSPVTDIKYDPALPPLASRARAALDRVERTRAYSRFKLDLLDEK